MKPYSGGVRHDYKDRLVASAGAHRRHWPWFLIGLLAPPITVSLVVVGEADVEQPPADAPAYLAHVPAQEAQLPLPATRATAAEPADDAGTPEVTEGASMLEIVVDNGDSMDTIFRRNGLSLGDLSAMAGLADVGNYLRRLRPGDQIRIEHRDGDVVSLTRELDEINLLTIRDNGSGFGAKIVEREVEVRTDSARGVIDSSLFEAGRQAGISDAIVMNLAGIFQWDIDFLLDVRIGDEFTVIYEELWRNGVKLRNGEIVAAEFINRGRTYRAARYVDETGRSDYFTPEGRSVRKAFIRAPVDFTRISSNFDLNRRHPILNTIRAHRGVDYAAPTGTPIRAAGDGKVIFRGVRNGYGNAVILRHGGNITTLYGHMSRFADFRVGSRVRQGQVIGYVGQSGLATGPHLHYEYRVGGVHRNPRTVTLPPADPVPAEYWEDFQTTTARLWHRLDLYQRTRLTTASN